MIEVITYADCFFRIPSRTNHRSQIENLLYGLKKAIDVKSIEYISEPALNDSNFSIEVEVYALYMLRIEEKNKTKKVEEYIGDVDSFLKRQLPNCNRVRTVKIVQMKR